MDTTAQFSAPEIGKDQKAFSERSRMETQQSYGQTRVTAVILPAARSPRLNWQVCIRKRRRRHQRSDS